MCPTFCRNALVLVLLSSLHIISPEVVSSDEQSCSDMIPMMVAGARVVRGKDWKWGDQDGSPPTVGTVLGPDKSSEGWFKVQWGDNTTNNYRMGDDDKCDLKTVQHDKQLTVPSSSSTTRSTSSSFSITTPQPESSTDSSPPPPTRHQCTCSKEISESQARTEAETAELAKEAGRLAVETAKVALEAAKATARAEEAERLLEFEAKKEALETARSIAKAEEAERLLAVEVKKVALEAAKFISIAEEAKSREALVEVEVKQMYLEAAKSVAKAEESWATNAAEELIFERDRRNQTLQSYVNNKH